MLPNKINPTPDNPDNLIPENISLVNQHPADFDKAKVLGINSQKPNQFFPAVVATTLTKLLLQI